MAFIGAAQSFGLAQEALEWAGQTHLQPAMPSGPALWAQAWVEGGLESARALRFLHSECGRSPLGAAAGFGGAIALDRESVARSLGLLGAHRGVVDALHARARLGQRLLDEGRMIGALLEKLGWDVSLGLTREYGLFRLREGFATGSSVMPQKQNPDLAELVRARGARLSAHAFEHERIACKLPSNYHRDHQLLKGPLLLGVSDVCETLGAARLLLEAVEPDPEGCRRSMRAELDAARVASERALAGVPFRDAYQEVAQSLPGRGFSRGVPEHVRADCSREYAQAAQERQEHADWLAAERSREEAAGRALRAPA